MKLHPPFIITSRLMPGLRVGDATISLDCGPRNGDGRTIYRAFIDTPAFEYEVIGLKSGCQGGTVQEGFASLLPFLGAAAEAYRYEMATGRKSENLDLFPPEVTEWAYQNSSEIEMACLEIEETPNLIEP